MAVDAEHTTFLAKPVAVEVQVEILMLEILMLKIPTVAATIPTRLIARAVAVGEAAG
jgi:hypothetical protein